jgi:hypothetical protein
MDLKVLFDFFERHPLIVTLVGFILTVFGLWRLRRQQRKDEVKAAFLKVCSLPSIEIATYEKVYQALFDFYDLKRFKDIFIPTADYFQDCLQDGYKIFGNKNLHDFKFPLLAKPHWLRSINKRLDIVEFGLESHPAKDKSPISEITKEFLGYFGAETFASLQACLGKRAWDARTFDLRNIVERENRLELTFNLGSYFNYVNHYEVMARELYFWLYVEQEAIWSSYRIRRLLPEKNYIRTSIFHPKKTKDLNSSVFCFELRPVKLGTNNFVIMNKGNGKYCTFIQKRGTAQVEYPGFYHVAPAGTFQPLSEFDDDIIRSQFKFTYTALREFLEEVYDLENADGNSSVDPFDIFSIPKRPGFVPGEYLTNQLIRSKAALRKTENYELITTGLLVDLVTMKPELTTVLYVKNEKLYSQSKSSGNWEGPVKEYEIGSAEFERFLDRNLNTSAFLPAGAISIAEGIKYFREEISA